MTARFLVHSRGARCMPSGRAISHALDRRILAKVVHLAQIPGTASTGANENRECADKPSERGVSAHVRSPPGGSNRFLQVVEFNPSSGTYSHREINKCVGKFHARSIARSVRVSCASYRVHDRDRSMPGGVGMVYTHKYVSNGIRRSCVNRARLHRHVGGFPTPPKSAASSQ